MAGRRRPAGRHRPLPRELRARRWRERPWLGIPRWPGDQATVSADLLTLTPDAARGAIADWLAARGEPAYRLRQIVPRMWERPAASWADATDLPAALRGALEQAFPIARLDLAAHQVSRDGTEKFLWKLADGEAIESVLIPEGKRRTLCISSQVGCALGCVFCATGQMGWRRNLSPAEIAGQVRETVIREPALKPTNVVFMGMGEPLLNWEHVDASLTILNHPLGLGIGARHITVSTVGILPNLAKLARRPEQFRLALSLHAPTPAQRLALMPIEKKYTLADVLAALRRVRRRVAPPYAAIRRAKKFPPHARAPGGVSRPPPGLGDPVSLPPGAGAPVSA